MPKTATPLNDTRIKSLKPRMSRYSVSDGGGLVLEVMASGSKIWRYRYSLHGKQQPVVTIGEYPATSLLVARERARRYAEIVAGGVSPVADAKKDRGAVRNLNTVKEFGDYWIEQQMVAKSAEYQRTTKRVLEKDVYPALGNKPLVEVTPGDVLAICDRIKKRGAPKMALHTRNVLKRMFEYAIARQLVTTNPAQAIVARFVATQESRDRVLSPDEIGRVLRAVYASDIRRPLKLAIHLLALTMVRKSELIEARWDEFDLETGVWRIPAERMKKDREHWVYLAREAVAMFRELHDSRTSDEYVFPTVRGADRPIGASTLNQAIRALDMDVQHFVLHDFRRTASTHLHEMGCASDAIEKALAHTIKGIKGVYNRAEYADERRRILALWAEFVGAQIDEGRKVVIGNFGAT
ncbi:tyrosine-type recombinase/integrase [Burkholderia ubonensis]|uniref:tyrosine-type recombinase/integrase n=1 Tax=Burkholderia ubonensis TaxID=101571 RepID=UPI00075396F8|nr:tyrosine-type recombinase/integrase [Burkholderia ubonensis]AOI71930.1 integrase [Burkholderia ubonensis]KUZ19765.1 integrase [Burkholderia ubonensis]KUZ30563.1 integrase [Burkholderia ubonensis]KUZ38679.1 integrase [Burkholderia ubonensis]KUZ42712.1 integrase [Burkholderia ubonensis]